MSLNEEVEILRNIPMFANIESSKLKLLAFTSERHAYNEGEYLFREGDEGDSAYIIVEGEADVIIETDDGPLTVAHFRKNALIGEIAILTDVPRTATVKATTRLDAMVISKELFFRLVMEFPQIAVEIMRELAKRLEATNARIRELSAA
ncbi:MAG: cyclic nucleotide-binding domain-containing protein [Rhodospirillaceae bacterium]|nr:cyclic nucleotide-binding domain-containing protein [Rhodospirillaceae bacterium]MYF87373.1 cyclic nucleotide-binding domain-containing protein [Rhodospirillaceae bacterium]MYH38587.1 cyclic nucleotide-binding domain-containing protein [Rhodospirillaceae bacterium]MYJ70294.1 cyclic nucleotide-binding domain-containing protein [Rhodospirillaceae bacterium]MYK13757.1 cyclic nucleotide-binding domain-containing protein [Rhodospirillaceae bacterium]